MAFIQTTILIFTFFSFFIGQIFRISLFNVTFPLIDLAIATLSLINFFQHLKQNRLKIKNKYFFYFLVFSLLMLSFSQYTLQIFSLTPFFYLLRLTFLLSLFIFPLNLNNKYKNIFIIFVIANVIFGVIQYLFWPDFTYFNITNWDPHLYRLISTYFDPTFTGLIYLFLLIKLFLDKKIPYRRPLIVLSYLAMSLTYSRSTFLSFLFAFGFISLSQKKIKILLISTLLVFITLILLPRQPGEGTKLERTSSIYAKIENYQEGFKLFLTSPLTGVGYNNLPIIRKIDPTSHAISGYDGSLLTILVTTGVIGVALFVFGFYTFFNQSNLLKKTMLISLLVHSLFANSLLYPWILLSLALF